MNTIKLIIGLSFITSMVGCATVNHIKMSDVSNFKSPSEVIAAKQLNGRSSSGKEYMVSSELLDHKIPFTYLKTFCSNISI